MAAAAPPSWLCLFSYLQQKPWSHCVYRVLGCAYSRPTTEAREMQCVVRFRHGRKGEVPSPRKLGYCFCRNRQRVLGRLCPDFFFSFFFLAVFVAMRPCLLLCGCVCCYAAVFVAVWASVVAACGLSSYRARPQVPLCNWNPPGSGIESMSYAGGFITTGPPRKSCPLTAVQVSPSPLASLCSVRHLPALS